MPKAYQQHSDAEEGSRRASRASRTVQKRRRILERRQLNNHDEELSVGARLARNRRERLQRLRFVIEYCPGSEFLILGGEFVFE